MDAEFHLEASTSSNQLEQTGSMSESQKCCLKFQIVVKTIKKSRPSGGDIINFTFEADSIKPGPKRSIVNRQ